MKNQPTEGKIDLKYLFFRFYTNWYYFAIAILVTLFAAYLYNKITAPVYAVSAKVLIEDQKKGPSGANELLEVVEVKERIIELEDEIGRLTSYQLVQSAIQRRDFGVSYFVAPNLWLNTFGNILVEEKSGEEFPFKVVLEPSNNQLVNVPVYIKILSKSKYQVQVQADADEAKLYNIEKNQLTDNPVGGITINKILSVDQPYQDKSLSFKIIPNKNFAESAGQGEYFFRVNTLDQLTKRYQAKLQVKPISRDSRILDLSTEGSVVSKEKDFLNALIEAYGDQNLTDKNKVGTETILFIDNQLADVSDSLSRAEQNLELFRRSIGGVDSEYDKYNVFEKLDALEERKALINNKLKDYNDMLSYLRSNKDEANIIPPSATGVDNPLLSNQIQRLSELYQQKTQIDYSATRKNPAQELLDNQIKTTKASIIENLNNIIRTSNTDIARINQNIAELQTNVSQLPQNERRLVDLQRQFDYNNETHNFYIRKRAEAAIALATNSSDLKVVDTAKQIGNAPVAPKTNAIFLIALLVGLVIPAASIAVSDFLDDTIKTKEDVREVTNIPVLGMIAHSSSGKGGYLAKGDGYKSVISESFRSLRVNLQYLAVGMDQKAIGITSSMSGEGKTFCAINLATVLALSGKRTIIIDADMRKPKVAQYLDLKNTFGLSSYLIRNNTLDEVIQPTKVKNFDVITSGPMPPNPIELLELREMRDLINRLKASYDYIIIDTPPIGFVSEYMILKQYLDVNIYIVRSNYTKKGSLEQINELYENRAFDNLSIVINDVKFSSTYGYAYKGKAKAYGYV